MKSLALALLGLACLPAASHAAGLQKDLDRLVGYSNTNYVCSA
jgi:hypothetical protein